MAEPTQAMTFDEFRTFLSGILLVGEDKLVPEASFLNDLAVDSIRWVEMALRLENLGLKIPVEAFWEIYTVGDAYEYYKRYYAGG